MFIYVLLSSEQIYLKYNMQCDAMHLQQSVVIDVTTVPFPTDAECAQNAVDVHATSLCARTIVGNGLRAACGQTVQGFVLQIICTYELGQNLR